VISSGTCRSNQTSICFVFFCWSHSIKQSKDDDIDDDDGDDAGDDDDDDDGDDDTVNVSLIEVVV
jgi:hypothetical protein